MWLAASVFHGMAPETKDPLAEVCSVGFQVGMWPGRDREELSQKRACESKRREGQCGEQEAGKNARGRIVGLEDPAGLYLKSNGSYGKVLN